MLIAFQRLGVSLQAISAARRSDSQATSVGRSRYAQYLSALVHFESDASSSDDCETSQSNGDVLRVSSPLVDPPPTG
jgi:hypothetical protein